MMQRPIHSMEQSGVHAVLGFLTQFLGHPGKETIAANLQQLLHLAEDGFAICQQGRLGLCGDVEKACPANVVERSEESSTVCPLECKQATAALEKLLYWLG